MPVRRGHVAAVAAADPAVLRDATHPAVGGVEPLYLYVLSSTFTARFVVPDMLVRVIEYAIKKSEFTGRMVEGRYSVSFAAFVIVSFVYVY